jgi:hypothetical protein
MMADQCYAVCCTSKFHPPQFSSWDMLPGAYIEKSACLFQVLTVRLIGEHDNYERKP